MPIDAKQLTSSRDFQQAYSSVKTIIRQHSKTFYFATGLLPRPKRRAIHALYAFCRATDDLVDKENASLEDVELWREQVANPPQDNPILKSWQLVREIYDVDNQYEQALIDGVAMDIAFEPYPTWDDLADYCFHVASTVGLLSLPIIGLSDGFSFEQAKPYALKLGIALQLTNILRDVGEDLGRGRIYFPLEDLERFDLTLADIQNQVYDQRFIDLMAFQEVRARQLYAESLPGIAMLDPNVRKSVAAAAITYRAILDEIKKKHYQVYHQRAHTSFGRKISLLPQILRQGAHRYVTDSVIE